MCCSCLLKAVININSYHLLLQPFSIQQQQDSCSCSRLHSQTAHLRDSAACCRLAYMEVSLLHQPQLFAVAVIYIKMFAAPNILVCCLEWQSHTPFRFCIYTVLSQTYTPVAKESPPQLTCMSLDCRRKLKQSPHRKTKHQDSS